MENVRRWFGYTLLEHLPSWGKEETKPGFSRCWSRHRDILNKKNAVYVKYWVVNSCEKQTDHKHDQRELKIKEWQRE